MICSLKYLREKYEEFNKLCFGGRLPVPVMRIGNAGKALGSVRYEPFRTPAGRICCRNIKLTISARYDLPQQELDDTILHEMIHLYLIYNNVEDDATHGHAFRRIMNDLNRRFSRHITVSAKGELRQSDNAASQNVILITEMKNGLFGISRPAMTRIFHINREISEWKEVKKMTWYNSSNPFFNKFPRCLKAKIYRIDKPVLDREIAGAIPITISSKGK